MAIPEGRSCCSSEPERTAGYVTCAPESGQSAIHPNLVVGNASPSARRTPNPLGCGRFHVVQIGLRQYTSGEDLSHKLVQKGGQKVNLRSL